MKDSKLKDKLLFLLPIFALLGLGYYAVNNSGLHNEESEAKAAVKKISPQEFDEIASEGAFVLDVHIPEQKHIEGTDVFIPYNQITENLDKLPKDKNTPILVYCRSGSMSAQASKELVDLGYSNVYDLVGGINAYREQNVSVYVTPDTKDLGTVVYGDVAETEFTLVNSTNNNLSITRVSTSCECTSAELEKETLEPYEEVAMNVFFDPAVHKDDTDLGDIVRTVYIETDNPNFERVTAEITARVVKR